MCKSKQNNIQRYKYYQWPVYNFALIVMKQFQSFQLQDAGDLHRKLTAIRADTSRADKRHYLAHYATYAESK